MSCDIVHSRGLCYTWFVADFTDCTIKMSCKSHWKQLRVFRLVAHTIHIVLCLHKRAGVIASVPALISNNIMRLGDTIVGDVGIVTGAGSVGIC